MALSAKELAALHARVQYAHYNGFSLAKADEYAAALGEAHPEGVAKTSTAHLLAVTTKQVLVPKPVPAKPGVSTVVKPPVQTKPVTVETKPVVPVVHVPPHEPSVQSPVVHPHVPAVPPPHASAAETLPTAEEVLGGEHEGEHDEV